ncbi:hypothetical protein H072_6578 [Dactylellina haptotyla CBS 200.50]|uniref:Phospholipid/glycerol acyltransferase domain-containing protein n=1 Tax=Dactylellina haptotyla (strain CBS 200.50) TaxID=1284197 RepID=S8BWC9_DACHA|nr:hypothetical protein H072_6578 [Dactylellina haptotyla CBS 200.50]
MTTASDSQPPDTHLAGKVRYGGVSQAIRLIMFLLYFAAGSIAIVATQFIGAPLYFYNRDWFYAYIALTKQSFGILVTTGTQWWTPTVIRVSGDRSIRGQIRITKDGLLECDFPERMVFIANHQLYSDWLYIWWIAYSARMHGAIYIILKESLKWVPIVGWGMQFYGFIFLARKWDKDQKRFQHRLQLLAAKDRKPAERPPMWLLIFPEGTNMCSNARASSKKFADKMGIKDHEHVLLPRITGLQYCLKQLDESVEWLYDCTMAYEGIPRDKYGQDIFTLRAQYLQGRLPKSVNLHFRRFRISEIPYNDTAEFEQWMRARWIEKDQMMETYMQTGRLPGDDEEVEVLGKGGIEKPGKLVGKTETGKGNIIETEVKLRSWLEVPRVYAVLGVTALMANIVSKIWAIISISTGARVRAQI